MGTFTFYIAPLPDCWASMSWESPLCVLGVGGSWVAHPGWLTDQCAEFIVLSQFIGRWAGQSHGSWGSSLAMRGTGGSDPPLACALPVPSLHSTMLYCPRRKDAHIPVQLPPPHSPVPSHALTHTLLKPDLKAASRAGVLSRAGRAGGLGPVCWSLPHPAPLPARPGQAGQASHNPASLASYSAPQGPPPPWLGPETGTGLWTEAPEFSRCSMGLCPDRLHN